jgi:hypothetical protein
MRRVGFGGMAAALIVGLGLTVAAAEEPQGDSKSAPAKSGWWSGWFGDKAPSAKPKAKFKGEKNAPVEDRPAPSNPAESAATEQKRQMNAYLRRVEVCLRLRQVAEQTGNADLQRQAEEMDARAWEIYRRQTAQLSMPDVSANADIQPAIKKSAKKPAVVAERVNDRPYDAPAAAMPARSPEPLSGDFEQRERSLINGTFMGRDKP